MNDIDDLLMPKKEPTFLARIKDPIGGLRWIFDTIFERTATTKQVLPVMDESIANIIREAQALQAGMGHLNEIYSGSQEVSNQWAHLTLEVINLPVRFQGDPGFWSYALDLVDAEPGGAFEEGAESVNLDQLILERDALNRVIAHKEGYRDRARDEGISH